MVLIIYTTFLGKNVRIFLRQSMYSVRWLFRSFLIISLGSRLNLLTEKKLLSYERGKEIL